MELVLILDFESWQRFFDKIEKTSTCWNWIGADNGKGYGWYWDGKKYVSAHRFSYILYNGKIPKNLVIDHICKNKKCVNPEHLRAVTQNENATRKDNNKPKYQLNKTHCPRGHPYSGKNLIIINTKRGECRRCRICNLESKRRNREKNGRGYTD